MTDPMIEINRLTEELAAAIAVGDTRRAYHPSELPEHLKAAIRMVAVTPSSGCVFFDVNVACEEPGCAVCGTEETSDV